MRASAHGLVSRGCIAALGGSSCFAGRQPKTSCGTHGEEAFGRIFVQVGNHVMTAGAIHADAEWNAGDLGCGPLVLDLRRRLRAMPGRVLKVIALDPGAPEDLPAWCRVTRNELMGHDPAEKSFWIRSRDNWD